MRTASSPSHANGGAEKELTRSPRPQPVTPCVERALRWLRPWQSPQEDPTGALGLLYSVDPLLHTVAEARRASVRQVYGVAADGSSAGVRLTMKSSEAQRRSQVGTTLLDYARCASSQQTSLKSFPTGDPQDLLRRSGGSMSGGFEGGAVNAAATSNSFADSTHGSGNERFEMVGAHLLETAARNGEHSSLHTPSPPASPPPPPQLASPNAVTAPVQSGLDAQKVGNRPLSSPPQSTFRVDAKHPLTSSFLRSVEAGVDKPGERAEASPSSPMPPPPVAQGSAPSFTSLGSPVPPIPRFDEVVEETQRLRQEASASLLLRERGPGAPEVPLCKRRSAPQRGGTTSPPTPRSPDSSSSSASSPTDSRKLQALDRTARPPRAGSRPSATAATGTAVTAASSESSSPSSDVLPQRRYTNDHNNDDDDDDDEDWDLQGEERAAIPFDEEGTEDLAREDVLESAEDMDGQGSELNFAENGHLTCVPGDSLNNRYVLIRQLGVGRSSRVWLAVDQEQCSMSRRQIIRELGEARAKRMFNPKERPLFVAIKVFRCGDLYSDCASYEAKVMEYINDCVRKGPTTPRLRSSSEPPGRLSSSSMASDGGRSSFSNASVALSMTTAARRDCLTILRDHFTVSGEYGTHHCLVMDVVGSGVDAAINEMHLVGLPSDVTRSILVSALQGLALLASLNMVHTDIKPENLLFVDLDARVAAEMEEFQATHLRTSGASGLWSSSAFRRVPVDEYSRRRSESSLYSVSRNTMSVSETVPAPIHTYHHHVNGQQHSASAASEASPLGPADGPSFAAAFPALLTTQNSGGDVDEDGDGPDRVLYQVRVADFGLSFLVPPILRGGVAQLMKIGGEDLLEMDPEDQVTYLQRVAARASARQRCNADACAIAPLSSYAKEGAVGNGLTYTVVPGGEARGSHSFSYPNPPEDHFGTVAYDDLKGLGLSALSVGTEDDRGDVVANGEALGRGRDGREKQDTASSSSLTAAGAVRSPPAPPQWEGSVGVSSFQRVDRAGAVLSEQTLSAQTHTTVPHHRSPASDGFGDDHHAKTEENGNGSVVAAAGKDPSSSSSPGVAVGVNGGAANGTGKEPNSGAPPALGDLHSQSQPPLCGVREDSVHSGCSSSPYYRSLFVPLTPMEESILRRQNYARGVVVQSREYRSPEVLLGDFFLPSCDVWSIGCIAYELITGTFLFDANADHDTAARRVKERRAKELREARERLARNQDDNRRSSMGQRLLGRLSTVFVPSNQSAQPSAAEVAAGRVSTPKSPSPEPLLPHRDNGGSGGGGSGVAAEAAGTYNAADGVSGLPSTSAASPSAGGAFNRLGGSENDEEGYDDEAISGDHGDFDMGGDNLDDDEQVLPALYYEEPDKDIDVFHIKAIMRLIGPPPLAFLMKKPVGIYVDDFFDEHGNFLFFEEGDEEECGMDQVRPYQAAELADVHDVAALTKSARRPQTVSPTNKSEGSTSPPCSPPPPPHLKLPTDLTAIEGGRGRGGGEGRGTVGVGSDSVISASEGDLSNTGSTLRVATDTSNYPIVTPTWRFVQVELREKLGDEREARDAEHFLRRCLQWDPAKRADAVELLQSRWLTQHGLLASIASLQEPLFVGVPTDR